jgi:hypothetical protein
MNIHEMVAAYERDIERDDAEVKSILDGAKAQKRANLTVAESQRADILFDRIAANKAALKRAKEIAEQEARDEADMQTVIPTAASKRSVQAYEEVVRIGDEPHTYSRGQDPEGKGTAFLTDVALGFRGNPQANERLARHMREYEVDNPNRQTRAAGDTTTAAFPNIVIPAYLVAEYAAKPSNARPFADICRHVDLPPQGMKIELAKGNTSVSAALQTSELVAAGGGNFDADPLELSVQTAESWALVSRQSLERGRATEGIVLNDMLDQMNALIDSTLITQTTTGLFDVATRIDASGTANDLPTLYPLILQAASKVSQTLLNRGKPTHVVMAPRRWYWAQSVVGTSWPMINQPGAGGVQAMGSSTANGYNDGLAGILPAGLGVVMDANVQTAALATAQTGGTQDVLYVVSAPNCVLLEPGNREVFIRAEAPAANQLAVMLVCYEYFAYTFQQYPAGAAYKINGVATVAPTGF